MRHLEAVQPVTPRRGIALIRVSKERERMISPENQRYAIEQYAARERITVVEWVEGIDESGSRRKSAWWAKLDGAVERIEKREADVLLVWRIDRTARNRVRWAIASDRVETAGGYIESATEPNDRSPAGRFGRGVMAEHAAFIAESIGATWKETHERRVRHGLTPGGGRRYGYTYSRENGYQIDPIEGPKLAAMYEAYASGESAWSITGRFSDPTAVRNDAGRYPPYAVWTPTTLLNNLDSGFGAGLVKFRDEIHPGAHEAVISEDLWARYVEARGRRRQRPRAERSPYVYSGVIYCHCGSRMTGRIARHGERRYACTASFKRQGVSHPNASISEIVVTETFTTWLAEMRDELNAAARVAPRRPRLVHDPAKDISAKLAGVAQRLDSATMKFVDDLIPHETYERIRASLEHERSILETELARAAAQQTVRPIAIIGDMVDSWETIPTERKRAALSLLVERIQVNPPNAPRRIEVLSALGST